MCANCLTQLDAAVANAAVTAAVLARPVHRFLADLGIVAAPDPVARDVRTVAFLRSLDLDPVEVLGRAAVDRADVAARCGRAAPAPAPRTAALRPATA